MDNISPNHYKKTSFECIDAMRIVFGDIAVADFCICNAWKYLWRWENKNGEEDLRKARWYLDFIPRLEADTERLNRYASITGRMFIYLSIKLAKIEGAKDGNTNIQSGDTQVKD